ncbi:MAG: Uma2 family endonuclease [Bacteroidales bacterium]|nr:Uma2 family endonuclease [Bacteroidales bacterium]
MAEICTAKLTAEEFFEWRSRPENQNQRWELENGEVVEMPSPGEMHGVLCFLIARILGNYLFTQGNGYLCTNDTGLLVSRQPDTVRGPDVMLFLSGKPLSAMNRGYSEGIPELVVEIVSPSDRMGRLHTRIKQYHQRGVKLVWVVFPEERTVNVYRPDEFPKDLEEADELTGNGVLPDFRCRVADLFALPGQTQQAPNP